jgi:hypothetical protein
MITLHLYQNVWILYVSHICKNTEQQRICMLRTFVTVISIHITTECDIIYIVT